MRQFAILLLLNTVTYILLDVLAQLLAMSLDDQHRLMRDYKGVQKASPPMQVVYLLDSEDDDDYSSSTSRAQTSKTLEGSSVAKAKITVNVTVNNSTVPPACATPPSTPSRRGDSRAPASREATPRKAQPVNLGSNGSFSPSPTKGSFSFIGSVSL
jgi:hypothetical protein